MNWEEMATVFGMLIMWLRIEHRLTKLETLFKLHVKDDDELSD